MWPVRWLRCRLFHVAEGVQHCLGAGWDSGLVGNYGGCSDGVPGDDRQPGRCFLGDGDERGKRFGVPVGPDERPADVQPGGDAQFRVR